MGTFETFHDQLVGWFIPDGDGENSYPDESLMGPGLSSTGQSPPTGNAFENPDTRACVLTGLLITAITGGTKVVQIFDYNPANNSGPLRMTITQSMDPSTRYAQDFLVLPGGGIRLVRGMRVVVTGLEPGVTGSAQVNFRRL